MQGLQSLEIAYENAGESWSPRWLSRAGPLNPLLLIAEVGESGNLAMQPLGFQVLAE